MHIDPPHTHTQTHTCKRAHAHTPAAYESNGTEEKVFEKRKGFKEDWKELTEVEWRTENRELVGFWPQDFVMTQAFNNDDECSSSALLYMRWAQGAAHEAQKQNEQRNGGGGGGGGGGGPDGRGSRQK